MRKLSNEQKASLASQAYRFQAELHSPEGQHLLRYLVEGRGLSEATIARFQLGAALNPEVFGDELGHWAKGRVCIPFHTPTGIVLNRFVQAAPRDPSKPKYWQPSGSYIGLYNTAPIVRGERRVILCEGEIDCMTWEQAGAPAVGIPGAGNWANRSHYPAIFDGFDEVVYIQEDDEKIQEPDEHGRVPESAAERLGRQITEDLPNARIVKLPRGYDSNDILVQYGPEALLDFVKFTKGNQF